MGTSAPGAGWQGEMARALRAPEALGARLGLPATWLEGARTGAEGFKLFVPEPYLAKIRPGDPRDPLLLQVLPQAAEAVAVAGFVADPLGEAAATRAPGLIRKYQGRALLVTTGVCAIHCRYCFRRHFPYEEVPAGDRGWEEALETLRSDPTVDEAILSGGDPWAMAPERFAALFRELDRMPQLGRIRIHTRLPVVIPSRVDDALVGLLRRARARVVVVIHANHARELGPAEREALARLAGAGCLLLNQSVLLRGVNDRVEDLAALSLALVDAGVVPYYLHMLDPVAGAAHFDVPEAEARELVRGLMAGLPGYAVPRLVREVPGAESKTPVPV